MFLWKILSQYVEKCRNIWYDRGNILEVDVMAGTKKIRIEYYQVIISDIAGEKKEQLYDLRELITKAEALGLERSTFPYKKEKARLDQYRYDPTNDFWYLSFVRLRQEGLPVRAKKNQVAVSFHLMDDEFLGENVAVVYDCKNYIMAVQRNRDSLSSAGIQAYLTQLLDRSDKEISLLPVPMEKVLEKVGKAKIIRKITLKFASARTHKRKNISSFAGLFSYFDSFENSNSAVVSISVGRDKKSSLNCDMLQKTLFDIKEAGDTITGAEVTIKDSEEAKVEVLDLFSMKYHTFINVKSEKGESLDFGDCAAKICEKYKEKREEILEILGI